MSFEAVQCRLREQAKVAQRMARGQRRQRLLSEGSMIVAMERAKDTIVEALPKIFLFWRHFGDKTQKDKQQTDEGSDGKDEGIVVVNVPPAKRRK